MNSAPSSAQAKAMPSKSPCWMASDVPTRTGATAAGSGRTRAAMTQMRSDFMSDPRLPASDLSRAARELREVRRALGLVRLAALARFLAGVEEEVRVVRELLQARVAVLGGVEARLQQPQREGGEGEHLATPRDGLLLEALERHDGVDQAPVERLARVVLAAQEPDLLGALLADLRGEDGGAEAAVEGA